jgi:hypothetical protein
MCTCNKGVLTDQRLPNLLDNASFSSHFYCSCHIFFLHCSHKKEKSCQGRWLDDDLLRLRFLHAHREASVLAGELPKQATRRKRNSPKNLISFVFFALPV